MKLATLKIHWAAVVLAIMFSVSMVAPELVFRISLGNSFKGIYMHGSDGELFYLARMQQVYNGGSALDSPFLYEYRGNLPAAYALFSESVLAYPGKWLGIEVPELNLVYKTLFSAVIFILIYALGIRLMGDRLWAVAMTTFVVAGYRLITAPGILNFLGWKQVYVQFSLYARPVTTQVTWIIFWVFIHMMLSGLEQRKWKYFIYCGILFGLSFYVYLYDWTFLAVFTGVICAGAFYLRDKSLAGKTGATLLIGTAMGVPYILNMLAVVKHEYFPTYTINALMHASRMPDISKIGLVVASVFLWYIFKLRRRTLTDGILLALLATTFIVTNQQVITKHVLEVGHYHLFFNVFLYILILFYLCYQISTIYKFRYIKVALVLATVAALLNGYLMQSSSYAAQSSPALYEQKYGEVFKWLNANTAPGSVAFADDNLALLLTTYTRNYVYWNSAAALFLMPPDRLEYILFMYMKLNGVSPEALGGEGFFHTSPSVEQLKLASEYHDVDMLLYEPSRAVYRNDMIVKYRSFFKETPKENFRRYRLDYILRDVARDTQWNERFILSSFDKIADINGVIIYARRSSTK